MLTELTIHELADLFRQKTATPTQAAREYLDRIAALDPKVKAYLTVTGEAAKLATQTPADVLAVVETDGRVFTSAGPAASQWLSGAMVNIPAGGQATFRR